MITQERLHELLSYDSDTGVFTWRVARGSRAMAGAVAGSLHWTGYIEIQVDDRSRLAHRLAWLYVYGQFPPAQIDHINQVKADNRITNLRPATQSDNQQNMRIGATNTSGFRGVCWHKKDRKWQAQARMNGRNHYLGQFPTAEAASAAYQAFAKQNHGEFYYENPEEKQ